MIVYRISKEKHAKDLSGNGARLSGGRWNSKGLPVVYTSGSIALAMAEVLVHISAGLIPDDYRLVTIEIPDSISIEILDETSLPGKWKTLGMMPVTQKIGNNFLINLKAPCLKVPSAVVPGENNILINPEHPDFAKVKILKMESFDFDERLLN